MFKSWRKRRDSGAARLRKPMGIILKSKDEIEQMRVAGQLAGEVLRMIAPSVEPGVTTGELDRICHDYITDTQQAVPAPLNYNGFPRSICTSVMVSVGGSSWRSCSSAVGYVPFPYS